MHPVGLDNQQTTSFDHRNVAIHFVVVVPHEHQLLSCRTMPRISKRARALSCLEALLKGRMNARAVRVMDDDDDSLEDMKDLATAICLSKLRKRRYLQRPSKYRKSPASERF